MKRTITAKFVNLPKVGKKYGNVKDENDIGYAVPSAMTGRFVKGNTYEIEFEEQTWGENQVYVVTGITHVAGSSSAAPASGPVDRWFMPFVSNTVAHAIAAGLIKQVGDIEPWARQAYAAVRNIEKPFADDQ